MNGKTDERVPVDGLFRAEWVDACISPEKHGAFEGYMKGEPHKVLTYFWTGRRWMYKNRSGKWFPSVFGEKGDKWRGLCDPVSTLLVVKDDNTVEFPKNPVIGAMYYTEAGASWLCNGRHWVCKTATEDTLHLKSIAKEDATASNPAIDGEETRGAEAVREGSEKTSIAKAGALRRSRSTFVGTDEDISYDISGVEANYRNTKDSE